MELRVKRIHPNSTILKGPIGVGVSAKVSFTFPLRMRSVALVLLQLQCLCEGSILFPVVEEEAKNLHLMPGNVASPPIRKKSVTLKVEDMGGHLIVPTGAGKYSSSETLTDQVSFGSEVNLSNEVKGHLCTFFKQRVGKKRHSSVTSISSEASESEPEEEHQLAPPSVVSCKFIKFSRQNLGGKCKILKRTLIFSIAPSQIRKTSSTSIYASILQRRASKQRPSFVESEISGTSSTPRSSFQTHGSESPQMSSKAGVVVTSSRQSQRRSSSASAAAAFAIATAGSQNSRVAGQTEIILPENEELKFVRPRKESVLSSAATMRVLSVLRHWVAKHSQDFEDLKLSNLSVAFLEDILCSPALLPAENKAASQLLRLLTRDQVERIDLVALFAPFQVKSV